RRRIGLGHDYRNSPIAAFPDFGKDGNLSQKGNLLPRGFHSSATMPKDLDPFARWSGEVAHILNDAKDRHIDLLKHCDALAHHTERRFLRSGDDDAAVERDRLTKGELRVSGPWWQIDEQVIQGAPVHL